MRELLGNLLRDPLALEIALVSLVVLVAFFLLRRLSVFARELEKRRSLREYVQGLDLYFRGEYREAIVCLEKVLENDPENIEARICLGDCHREEGDYAEAHKHHFHVYKVFGRASTRNFWSLARDLHAQGQFRQAEEYLEKVLSDESRSLEGWSLMRDCQLSRGALEEALATQRRILRVELDGSQRQHETERLGAILVALGRDAASRGASDTAERYFEEAMEVVPGLVEARARRVDLAGEQGDEARRRALGEQLVELKKLGDAGRQLDGGARSSELIGEKDESSKPKISTDAALPLVAGPRLLTLGTRRSRALAEPIDRRRPVRLETHHPIFAEASPREYARSILGHEITCRCSECGTNFARWSEECSECGGVGTITSREEFYFDRVADLGGILDEIEENDRYVRALVDDLGSGDVSAREKLLEIGPRIADIVFDRLPQASQAELLVDLLISLGPDHIPSYLEAFSQCATPKRLGGRGAQASRSKALEQVMVGFGAISLTVLRQHVDTEDRAIRDLVIDVHILLGAAREFDQLQYCYSPVEIIDRLNRRSWAQLVPLVRAAASGGYLVETILVDRTFNHEQALLAVFREGTALESLASVLATRGFTPAVLETMVQGLIDPDLDRSSRQVVMSFGAAAVDHLFQHYLQRAGDLEGQATLRRLIVELGGLPVPRLTDHFTGKSEAAEQDVLRLIADLGLSVLSALADQYRKAGVLGFFNLDRGRLSHRRRRIVEAMAAVGGVEARALLTDLMAFESDPEMRRFIEGQRDEVTD